MRLGIDASNIRDGGGLSHLTQILAAADPAAHGFDSVIVWASLGTLARLGDRPWLVKRHERDLEAHYPRRAWWQLRRLGRLARDARCDLLYVPGGAFATDFRPIVTMSRNLLPFEWRELRRYGCSPTTLRLLLLRRSQSRSFRAANGTIFLTNHAQQAVRRVTGPVQGETTIIPHGLDPSFFLPEHIHRPIETCSHAAPLRMVYVSIVDLYKHQWHVVAAVAQLRAAGLPVSLTLIGPAYRPALRRLRRALKRFDPHGEFVDYAGPVAHADLPARYAGAELCIFASSCENMPNILLEAMASALPIACSNRGSMPEVLGDGGIYFDPEDPTSIAGALRKLIASPELRRSHSRAAVAKAGQFSWVRCAHETLEFLAHVAPRERRPAQTRKP